MSWSREFDEPIVAPDGTRLEMLREAIAYLVKAVPGSERRMPAAAAAAETLTYAAERGIAWMRLPRMGVLKALPHEARQFNPDAKEHHWEKRKLKRDE